MNNKIHSAGSQKYAQGLTAAIAEASCFCLEWLAEPNSIFAQGA
jgi:hypothetical protein